MRRIDTLSPGTLQEALEILAREGEGVKVIAGGTDLVVQVLERRKSPRLLLNLSRIGDLREIGEDGETVRIGALVTHRQIERSPILTRRAPLLCEAALLIGSPQLRNLATIGGNLMTASPVADSTPPLMALDATVSLRSARGERKIPLRAFFLGPGKTVIRRDELLAEVSFAGLGPDAASFYERLGQRRLLSISKVGVALAARRDGAALRGVSISLGAVASTVIMAPRTAAFIEGKPLGDEVAREAARIAEKESRAITDLRSTESYRNRMAGALLQKGLARLTAP
ncbi:MAG: xanthine dehydrogenase family protein subunit M [Candidatus Aureabacteria bacterium]|nr:xanthine dehydrogenase family protein subunit M [Candidatus Auribacterota bacterium]